MVIPEVRSFDDRVQWLEARRKGIGGSDVPCILGLSRWKTPLQVWSQKVGLAPHGDDSTYPQRRGLHMEPFIGGELARAVEESEEGRVFTVGTVYGGEGRVAIAQHQDPAYSMMLYSPDALAKTALNGGTGEETVLCEYKSRSPFGRDEWEESVPPEVNAQVQHGLFVMGLQAAYVAVDLGSEFRWARVERDQPWIDAAVPRLLEFWDLVEKETPPPPSGDPGDKDALSGMFPKPQAGRVIALPGEALSLTEELQGLTAEQKEREERIEQIRNTLRLMIGEAEVGVLPAGAGKWSWKRQDRQEFVMPATSFRVLKFAKSKA